MLKRETTTPEVVYEVNNMAMDQVKKENMTFLKFHFLSLFKDKWIENLRYLTKLWDRLYTISRCLYFQMESFISRHSNDARKGDGQIQ